MFLKFFLQRSVKRKIYTSILYKDSFSIFLGNGSKASTSRQAESDYIEETSSEISEERDQDPDWLQTINEKFAASGPPSESSNSESQQVLFGL